MESLSLAYRVRNWDCRYETRGSLRHGRPLARLTISTALDGSVTHRLLSQPLGAACYGIWILLLQIAAKCPRRGVLADDNGSLNAEDLALMTHQPLDLMVSVLEMLCGPKIGLLEQVPLEVALQPRESEDLQPESVQKKVLQELPTSKPGNVRESYPPGTPPPPPRTRQDIPRELFDIPFTPPNPKLAARAPQIDWSSPPQHCPFPLPVE